MKRKNKINNHNNEIKTNKSLDKKKKKKRNLKVKNFNQIKNKITNKSQIIAKNKSKEKDLYLEKNRIELLYDMEKKSLIIQKMLRGYLTRKKYGKKLTNIKNKNLNDNIINIINNKVIKNNLKRNENNFEDSNSLRNELSEISINSNDLLFSEEESENLNESYLSDFE